MISSEIFWTDHIRRRIEFDGYKLFVAQESKYITMHCSMYAITDRNHQQFLRQRKNFTNREES